MAIFGFPRFYRPSDHNEAVWERGQFGSIRMVQMQFTEHCGSTLSLSSPKGERHSTTLGEGSSRWALVLPPNTIKIRGGRSIFLRHSQARVLPSHAVKTGRGRSTRYQAHVLPPYAVKTRGGRSAFRQAHVLPSHAIKTGRGRSTFHRLRQAHVLPPNTVKIRGGRPTRHYHEHWSSISPVLS